MRVKSASEASRSHFHSSLTALPLLVLQRIRACLQSNQSFCWRPRDNELGQDGVSPAKMVAAIAFKNDGKIASIGRAIWKWSEETHYNCSVLLNAHATIIFSAIVGGSRCDFDREVQMLIVLDFKVM